MEKFQLSDLKFKFNPDVEGDNNRGWIVHKIEAYYDGKSVGYINASYISKDRWNKWYKNGVIDWMVHLSGAGSGLIDGYNKKDWAKVCRNLWGHVSSPDDKWRGGYGTSSNEMTDKDWEASAKALIDAAEKKYSKQFKEDKNYFVDKPFVDYIRVNEEFQRKGIGTLLYMGMARELYKRYKLKKFYGSSLQTDMAKGAWKAMANHPKITLGTETAISMGKKKTRIFIDGSKL